MKKTFCSLFFLFSLISAFSQGKTRLDHSVYENWNEINNPLISNDGRWVAYEINPQKGDGHLVIQDLRAGKSDTIPRGYKAVFSHDSRYLVGMIKVPEDSVLQAKRDKKKPEEFFRDSLFVMTLSGQKLEKYPGVRSFILSEEENNLLVFHLAWVPEENDENAEVENKTNEKNKIDEKFLSIAKRHKLADLVVYDPDNGSTQSFENVSSYSLSKNGELLAFHQLARDTLIFSVVYSFDYPGRNLTICHEAKGLVWQLAVDDMGKHLAFLYSEDTLIKTGMELHHWQVSNNSSEVLIDSCGTVLGENRQINRNGKVYFSGDSERLFFGTSEPDIKETEDTLLKEEKVSVDVWSWHDQVLQPMQIKQLKSENNKTFLACYDFNLKKTIQLADDLVEEIQTMHKGNGDVMIGFADAHYGRYLSWEGLRYRDVYYVDPYTGKKELLARKLSASIHLSPFGNYLLYYSEKDSAWYINNIRNGETVNITANLPVNFYDEWNDIPMLPRSYGIAGFTENDKWVLVYDRYDIWKIDPSGTQASINLTEGTGRKHKITLRYNRLNEDEYFIDLKNPLYLSAFHEESMKDGYYLLNKGKTRELITSDHSYSGLQKAKNSDQFIFRKGDFRQYNDLYSAGNELKYPGQISAANPQSDNYLWGNVEMVEWLSFNGDRLKGLLYTPEDMDPGKKYPMLVYFYERYSNRIHSHRIPSPSKSIINPAWCTSNSYVVFVPDIIYRDGYPGQSAYDAIVSGTQAMLERYSFIDSERMGLQGQSWGGYQVAWLVTQTNLFAAAMAGAPVSNMTSAYGGIRWGTGMSRMFQYEETQSRIGGTLWEKQALYIENSPLFHVPKIETPLLIMHNDNDGAVPWYQGIELFVAMRRLSKPVWMLTYNDEEHNLTKWPNRIDLDIRMMQFFDHYLKGTDMPGWMSKGVPATEKNKITGRELLEE